MVLFSPSLDITGSGITPLPVNFHPLSDGFRAFGFDLDALTARHPATPQLRPQLAELLFQRDQDPRSFCLKNRVCGSCWFRPGQGCRRRREAVRGRTEMRSILGEPHILGAAGTSMV
jgi:hypothetical protein